jgi:hypothetical protein
MEKWGRLRVGLVATLTLLSGAAAPGPDIPPGCEKAGTSEKVEGQVAQIDPDNGKLTVRTSNGATYEFHAPKETLQGYKVGDHIEATRRSDPACKPSAS